MFIEPTITQASLVSSDFSGWTWLDTIDTVLWVNMTWYKNCVEIVFIPCDLGPIHNCKRVLMVIFLSLQFCLTFDGKNRLVRIVRKNMARANVPRKRMTERKKTSGTAWVTAPWKHAGPERDHLFFKHCLSNMQSGRTTSRRYNVIQSSGYFDVQLFLEN